MRKSIYVVTVACVTCSFREGEGWCSSPAPLKFTFLDGAGGGGGGGFGLGLAQRPPPGRSATGYNVFQFIILDFSRISDLKHSLPYC